MHKNRSCFFFFWFLKINLKSICLYMSSDCGRKLEPRANTGRTCHSERKAPNLARNHKPGTSCFGATQKNTLPRATIKEHAKKTQKPKYKQQQLNEHMLTFVWKTEMVFNGLIKRQLGNEFTFSEYFTLPQNLVVWSRAWTFRDYRSIFTPMETIFGDGRGRLHPPSLIMSI